jgi:uncharacterized protein
MKETLMSRSSREVAEEVCKLIADGGIIADLFAADGVLAWPFRMPGQPAEVRGRDAIRAHLTAMLGPMRELLAVESVEGTIHETDDPEVVMLQLVQHGQSRAAKAPYQLSALAVIRVRDGEIVRYDDYVNPIGLATLFGRQRELAAALMRRPTPQWAMSR